MQTGEHLTGQSTGVHKQHHCWICLQATADERRATACLCEGRAMVYLFSELKRFTFQKHSVTMIQSLPHVDVDKEKLGRPE